MSLFDLVFSDLYVTPNLEMSHYKESSDSTDTFPIPPELKHEILELQTMLKQYDNGRDFRVIFKGRPLRAVCMKAVVGNVYVCRHFGGKSHSSPDKIKTMAELGFPKRIVDALMSPKTKSGLIIFEGQPGSGKSTSASSYLIERISAHGGTAWCLERPPERALEGRHGRGICYQVEVDSDDDFGNQIELVVRAGSNVLFIGEVRTAAAAREAVLAAAGGMLVILTFHAGELLSGLKRFARLCGETDLLAEKLVAVLHLTLQSRGSIAASLPGNKLQQLPGKTIYKDHILHVDPLIVTGRESDPEVIAIKTAIRSDNLPGNSGIAGLTSIAKAQKNNFVMGDTPSEFRRLPS